MIQTRWLRVGGGAGIVFVVLVWAYVLWAPLMVSTPEPPFDGPAKDWLAYAQATRSSDFVAAPLLTIALFAFLVFAVSLSVKLRSSDNGPHVPSTLVIVMAGLLVGLYMAASGVSLAASFRVADLTATSAALLYGLDNGLFVMTWLAIGGLLAAAGVGGLTSRTLPGWLAWPALFVGVGFLVAAGLPLTALWFAPYVLFYVWVVAASIVLIRSKPSPRPA
jgi:hypothetical protein